MIHWLKTDAPYFEQLWNFEKPYEVRPNNDRFYEVGDLLILSEGVVPHMAPRAVVARVESILTDEFEGINTGYVGLGLTILGQFADDDLTLFTHQRGRVTSEQWRYSKTAKQPGDVA